MFGTDFSCIHIPFALCMPFHINGGKRQAFHWRTMDFWLLMRKQKNRVVKFKNKKQQKNWFETTNERKRGSEFKRFHHFPWEKTGSWSCTKLLILNVKNGKKNLEGIICPIALFWVAVIRNLTELQRFQI